MVLKAIPKDKLPLELNFYESFKMLVTVILNGPSPGFIVYSATVILLYSSGIPGICFFSARMGSLSLVFPFGSSGDIPMSINNCCMHLAWTWAFQATEW